MDWVIKTFDPWLESRKASNTLIIFLILLVSIPLIGIGIITTRSVIPYGRVLQVIQLPEFGGSSVRTAQFACDGGKSVVASFASSSVELALSDGRRLTLPQTLSTSGVRYANQDGSFVFGNKDDTAFVTESGKETYSGCVSNR